MNCFPVAIMFCEKTELVEVVEFSLRLKTYLSFKQLPTPADLKVMSVEITGDHLSFMLCY